LTASSWNANAAAGLLNRADVAAEANVGITRRGDREISNTFNACG
jgi:hypothetical protein